MSEINGMYTSDAQAIHDSRGRSRPESESPSTWRHARRDARWLSGRAEELPQDGMHLHHLLPPDRLVQLIMMPTESKTPVPEAFPTVPIMSAPAAKAPTEAPEITATTGMYRSSTRRKIRGSRRNPGICIPLDSI